MSKENESTVDSRQSCPKITKALIFRLVHDSNGDVGEHGGAEVPAEPGVRGDDRGREERPDDADKNRKCFDPGSER